MRFGWCLNFDFRRGLLAETGSEIRACKYNKGNYIFDTANLFCYVFSYESKL